MDSNSLLLEKENQLANVLNKEREIETSYERLFLLGVEYDGGENSAVLKFYDTEEQCIRELHDRTGHRPYCLTDLRESVIRERTRRDVEIETVERRDLLEDELKEMRKILVSTPQDVGGRGGVRKEIGEENAYEAWIPYHLNYLYDRDVWPCLFYDVDSGIPRPSAVKEEKKELVDLVSEEEKELVERYLPVFSEEIPNIRFTAMDIEVKAEEKRISQPKNADKSVMSVSFVDGGVSDAKEKRQVFLLEDETKEKKLGELEEKEGGYLQGIIQAKDEKISVRVYQNERNLILDTFIRIADVPLLLTFNGDAYDLYYLYERARKLGIDRKYIPFTVTARGRLREARMKVGVHLDMYTFFRNAAIKSYVFKEKYESVSLNAIATTLLDKEKLHVGPERFEELDQLSLRELAVYNFYDSYLTAELFKYNDWIPLKILVALSRVTLFPIRELSRRGVSSWIKNWIKAEHRHHGFLIPNDAKMQERERWAENELRKNGIIPEAISRDKKFRGGTVLEPKKGIWFGVYVLDFASLYPSVIKVHNISYETVLCPHEECRENRLKDLPYWICTKRTGIISKLVGLIRDVRVEYFKPLSKKTPKDQLTFPDVMQGALKVLINASYGVLGAEHFPFYEVFTAESVTAVGRRKINRITEKARDMGLEVLYGDTDSVFINKPEQKRIDELIQWSSEELKVDLEIDKVYNFLALSSRKKNYFGIVREGETDVKGMMVIKRNTPPFLKREFKRVTEILKDLSPSNVEEIKERLASKVKEIIEKINDGEYPLDMLAFHTQLTKPIKEYRKTTPQHVQAAKELEQHGEQVKAGQIITYVKTRDGVAPLEYAEPQEVNWKKYIEFAESAFNQLLNAFDLSFEKIKQEAKGIKGLDEFM